MSIKLLYVDDEPINLQLISISLQSSFNVLTANSGYEGLKILQENSDIAIVISDMKMPQMDGIVFIYEAKKIRPELQYYILTGYDDTEEITNAIEKGDVIKKFKKPFKSKEMISVLLQNCYKD